MTREKIEEDFEKLVTLQKIEKFEGDDAKESLIDLISDFYCSDYIRDDLTDFLENVGIRLKKELKLEN